VSIIVIERPGRQPEIDYCALRWRCPLCKYPIETAMEEFSRAYRRICVLRLGHLVSPEHEMAVRAREGP
jgi:hypothetical protein